MYNILPGYRNWDVTCCGGRHHSAPCPRTKVRSPLRYLVFSVVSSPSHPVYVFQDDARPWRHRDEMTWSLLGGSWGLVWERENQNTAQGLNSGATGHSRDTDGNSIYSEARRTSVVGQARGDRGEGQRICPSLRVTPGKCQALVGDTQKEPLPHGW